MPTTQIELDDRDKSLDGVIDRRHWKEGVGMGHKALESGQLRNGITLYSEMESLLRDPLQHGFLFQDEGRKGDSGQVGAWPQLGNNVRED